MPCPPTSWRTSFLAVTVLFFACHGEPQDMVTSAPSTANEGANLEPEVPATTPRANTGSPAAEAPDKAPPPSVEKAEPVDADLEERLRVGIELIREEKFDQAQTWFEKMSAEREDSAAAHYNLGWLHGRAGRVSQAISSYRRAIQLDPEHPRAYNNLGYTLKMAGKTEEAIDTYIEGIARVPDNTFARNNLKKLITELRCRE